MPRVRRPVQIIAHRGASRVERENTLAAFRRAGSMGADAVELDVRVAADGALVVHHDPLLADGRALHTVRTSGLPAYVPALSAALDAAAGMWVNVEIKNSPGEPGYDPGHRVADATVAELEGHADAARFLISCFDLPTLDRCRHLAPEIATAYLCLDPAGALELLRDRGHQALHPWDPTVTPALLDECHEAGLAVNAWTCDDPARQAELIAWGIDGICTNVPDVALAVRDASPAAG